MEIFISFVIAMLKLYKIFIKNQDYFATQLCFTATSKDF